MEAEEQGVATLIVTRHLQQIRTEGDPLGLTVGDHF